MEEEFKHHEDLNKEADRLLREQVKKDMTEDRVDAFVHACSKQWEQQYEADFVNDDNRVFKDEDIKKCQEATAKKLIESMEAVAATVKPYVRKISSPFLDLGDIQLSGVLPNRGVYNTDFDDDKPLKKEKLIRGGDKETWKMTIDHSGSLNPCAEIDLPMNDMADSMVRATQAAERLSEALTEPLDPAELVKANMIEDYLESYLTDHYSSGTLEYDVDLPEKVSPRVLAFIRARMYNWTIYTINEQKWRLTWG